jgi:hypothetical protein
MFSFRNFAIRSCKFAPIRLLKSSKQEVPAIPSETLLIKKLREVLNEETFFTLNNLECSSDLLVEKDKSKNEWTLIHDVDELLECATPATFGISNKKVYDEEYRKAKAIENFHTTFDTSVVYVLRNIICSNLKLYIFNTKS